MENIILGGGNEDPFYRYRMPSIQIVTRKKQTIWLNICDIAKALNRSIPVLVSSFKKSLSTSMQYKQKAKECVINGNFTLEHLRQVLQQYIDIHVICKNCGNPETVNGQCNACGK